jgi:hypothetical protein
MGTLVGDVCVFDDNDYYLAGCTMFPHLPAPISQLCSLPSPIIFISPVFFL